MSMYAKQTANSKQISDAKMPDAGERGVSTTVSSDLPPQNLPPHSPVYDTSVQEQTPPLQSTDCHPVSQQCTPPRKPLRMGFAPDIVPPLVVPVGQAGPKRDRKQQRMYDPSIGKSMAPQPVPEDV